MEAEVVMSATELVSRYPHVRAIVMECTNLPPFSRAVEAKTGRKVWDIISLGKWLYAGAAPPLYQSS